MKHRVPHSSPTAPQCKPIAKGWDLDSAPMATAAERAQLFQKRGTNEQGSFCCTAPLPAPPLGVKGCAEIQDVLFTHSLTPPPHQSSLGGGAGNAHRHLQPHASPMMLEVTLKPNVT